MYAPVLQVGYSYSGAKNGFIRIPTLGAPTRLLADRSVFAVFTQHVSADAQVSSQTVLGNVSPVPHVSSKCVFVLLAICAPPQATSMKLKAAARGREPSTGRQQSTLLPLHQKVLYSTKRHADPLPFFPKIGARPAPRSRKRNVSVQKRSTGP